MTDPFDRQLCIGLGCFLELLRLAAAEEGLAARIVPFPEGAAPEALDARPVARVTFGGAAAPDPLFAVAPRRRSAKLPFDVSRPVRAEEVAALRGTLPGPVALGAATAPEEVAALRDLVWRAWAVEAETPAAHRESVDLMRLGAAEVAANPDGISLWGLRVEPLVASGALTREAMLPGQPGYSMMEGQYRAMLAATPAHVWLTTPGNSREEQLEAGRAWLRLNLAATAAGLGLHPVSQALQE